jgi:hypothetical protein
MARGQHLLNQLRVALDVRLVTRDVRHAEQRDEFVDDRALVLLSPLPRCLRGGIALRCGQRWYEDEKDQPSFHDGDI